MSVPGIWKVGDHVGDRPHRLVRGELERGAEQVAVEDHVQVLVGGDPGQQLVADRVAGELAGVAVRDPGGELLERDVGQRADQVVAAARM